MMLAHSGPCCKVDTIACTGHEGRPGIMKASLDRRGSHSSYLLLLLLRVIICLSAGPMTAEGESAPAIIPGSAAEVI